MTDEELIREAFRARERSYCPYSGFAVGAALLCKNGRVYLGCNIENAAFSPTNCAERTAIFKAVSEGDTEFSRIAIVGGDVSKPVDGYAYPCGVCRQVMMEFCNPDTFEIIVAKSVDDFSIFTLKELFPKGFGPDNL
ncbi:MAG: cytidine deaminase [Lachnospiraceae bacterium]|nr:cytidine deaminase [Lachnospiraceae bacterium]